MTQIEIKIRGYHLDLYCHVNNARYLEFLEEARWDFFEKNQFIGVFNQQKLGFIISNINISFLRPAQLHDNIVISSHIVSLSNKNGVMEQIMIRKSDSKVLTQAKITFVIMDLAQNKVLKLEGNLRTLLDKIMD